LYDRIHDLDHIGKILNEEFMEPYKLSQNALAKAIGVAPSRITGIVKGRRAIKEHIETTLARIVPFKEKSA
jgi:addiction module HigA family antidote